MEATRTSVTSGNEQMMYNMDPAYQAGYTQQEVDGKIYDLSDFWLILEEFPRFSVKIRCLFTFL